MSTVAIDEEQPILVDFAPAPGVRKTALSVEQLAEKSAQALDVAMGTVRQMAQRTSSLRETLPDEFTKVKLEFGVKLDAEAGALVSQVDSEANINVTLTWERPEE